MAKQPKELGELKFYKVAVQIMVDGPLYASSPTTSGGIKVALKSNQPSEAQIAYREGLGEQITDPDELAQEIKDAVPEGNIASTVFRRNEGGHPYLHSNYLKGHLRECGDVLSRPLEVFGLQALVTKTVSVYPKKLYAPFDGKEIFLWKTFFAPEVRLSTGVTVRQPTELIQEYFDSPTLDWQLLIVADPRWSRDLLHKLLTYGATRGIGPGRGRDESQYAFFLGNFDETTNPFD